LTIASILTATFPRPNARVSWPSLLPLWRGVGGMFYLKEVRELAQRSMCKGGC